MADSFPYKIYPCGDHAVTADFGNVIDEEVNKHVLALFHLLKQKNIPGVKDIIPAYSSITLVYDVVAVLKQSANISANQWMVNELETVLNETQTQPVNTGNIIIIPVCYETPFALDLQEMAAQKNMPVEEIIQVHSSKQYRVYMLGFLPGFPYMGTVDKTISMPRRQTPRTKVAEGSVGIAGLQTGIYSMESPGGWNIIGQTPLKLFNAGKAQTTLLQAGDTVQFYSITATEFNRIKSAQ